MRWLIHSRISSLVDERSDLHVARHTIRKGTRAGRPFDARRHSLSRGTDCTKNAVTTFCRVVAAVEAGTWRNKVAPAVGVSVSCVVKLMQRLQRTGTILPVARGKKVPCIGRTRGGTSRPGGGADLTLDEMRRALAARGIFVGCSSVNRFSAQVRSDVKKSRYMRGNTRCRRCTRSPACQPVESRSCPADVYRRDVDDDENDPAARSAAFRVASAWSVRSRTAIERHQLSQWVYERPVLRRLVIDGATNGSSFRTYVDQLLAPMFSAGDIVTLDNQSHSRWCGTQLSARKFFYL